MISKVYTYRESPAPANEMVLYRFLAAMMTIRRFKSISMPKLQVYLWGLRSIDNKQALLNWKKENRITNTPWLIDDDTPQILTQCICNHFVKAEQSQSGKVAYVLDYEATHFFQEVQGSEIESYIMSDLDEIGVLTDKLLNNMVFDF